MAPLSSKACEEGGRRSAETRRAAKAERSGKKVVYEVLEEGDVGVFLYRVSPC